MGDPVRGLRRRLGAGDACLEWRLLRLLTTARKSYAPGGGGLGEAERGETMRAPCGACRSGKAASMKQEGDTS